VHAKALQVWSLFFIFPFCNAIRGMRDGGGDVGPQLEMTGAK